MNNATASQHEMEEKLAQEKLAQVAYQQKRNYDEVGGALGGSSTMGLDEPKRLSLIEDIKSQLYRATRDARKVERLSELKYLLDKNPEVARILDLMEEVRR